MGYHFNCFESRETTRVVTRQGGRKEWEIDKLFQFLIIFIHS